jgi:hypothetical protein
MICTMSRLTAFDVADYIRPWGKIHDFLLEFPAFRARYISVDAHVGFGVKEIWAPIESVARIDAQKMAVTIRAQIDSELAEHLSRLETPRRDSDELRLHRLYHTVPDWVEPLREKGAHLRKHSRLLRGSELLGLEAISRDGMRGIVDNLFFDDEGLNLKMIEIALNGPRKGQMADIFVDDDCVISHKSNTLYFGKN